jgi:hypothetical protein
MGLSFHYNIIKNKKKSEYHVWVFQWKYPLWVFYVEILFFLILTIHDTEKIKRGSGIVKFRYRTLEEEYRTQEEEYRTREEEYRTREEEYRSREEDSEDEYESLENKYRTREGEGGYKIIEDEYRTRGRI